MSNGIKVTIVMRNGRISSVYTDDPSVYFEIVDCDCNEYAEGESSDQ